MTEQQTEPRQDTLPGLAEWMGAVVIEKEAGRAVVRLPVQPHLTHGGEDSRVAGGVVMSLMDFAVHHALESLMTPDQLHATIEMKLNFIRPGRMGTLLAEASIVNKGRRIAVAEGTITQEDTGQVVAKALSTETYVQTERTND